MKFKEIKNLVLENYISTLKEWNTFDDHTIELIKSSKNIEELIASLDITECDASIYILGLIVED